MSAIYGKPYLYAFDPVTMKILGLCDVYESVSIIGENEYLTRLF